MNEEKIFFCPLECGARIKSLSKHLTKCQNKKLLGVKYKTCKYNSSHIIKNELYELHLISCESKKKFEEDIESDEDDDLKLKVEQELSNKEEINQKNKEKIIENKNKEEEDKDKKVIMGINKRKRRYIHEKTLFKNENEIDKECMDFFNKVYI